MRAMSTGVGGSEAKDSQVAFEWKEGSYPFWFPSFKKQAPPNVLFDWVPSGAWVCETGPCFGCLIWVWVKIKPPGDRRFWSMFPLARASHFGVTSPPLQAPAKSGWMPSLMRR